MPFDSDVALFGTGVAPLIAASHLLSRGRSVLVLNPDWDFFTENSELPLDPFWPLERRSFGLERLRRNLLDGALSELRPDFPGAVEGWVTAPGGGSHGHPGGSRGFHDVEAPHVRSRSWLWMGYRGGPQDPKASGRWEAVEEMYLEASDAGLDPRVVEGIAAASRFPGFAGKEIEEGLTGVMIPMLCDADVVRYRNGLSEYVRERLGPERMVVAATQVEPIAEGVRYHAGGRTLTARLRDGMMVFRTPRLERWIRAHARCPAAPVGVRLWEEWSLTSREPLDPSVVGIFGDMIVWAEAEGAPARDPWGLTRLAVLRPGPRLDVDSLADPQGGEHWAGADSFADLSSLCHDFLNWERFSVRTMRPRGVFEWEGEAGPGAHPMPHGTLRSWVVDRCDGPLVEVVRNARAAADRFG